MFYYLKSYFIYYVILLYNTPNIPSSIFLATLFKYSLSLSLSLNQQPSHDSASARYNKQTPPAKNHHHERPSATTHTTPKPINPPLPINHHLAKPTTHPTTMATTHLTTTATPHHHSNTLPPPLWIYRCTETYKKNQSKIHTIETPKIWIQKAIPIPKSKLIANSNPKTHSKSKSMNHKSTHYELWCFNQSASTDTTAS